MSRHVLYLMPNAVPGGAERATMMMVASHDRRRYTPSLLFFSDGPLVDEGRQLGVRTDVLHRPMRFRHPDTVVAAVWQTLSAVHRQHVDLIHSCMGYAHLVGGTAAAFARTPAVVYQHGPVDSWMDGAATVIRCDRILTNSQHTERQQRERSWRQRPMTVVPLAVSARLSNAERAALAAEIDARHALATDDVVVGTIARFDPQKGLDVTLAAMAPLLRARPRLRLLIVGGQYRHFFPAYEQELRALAAREGVTERVTFAGYQLDVRPYLARMSVLVHASQQAEAFGLTILEAMACGVPVVAARLGGVPELVDDGVDGLLHTPGDEGGLRAAITLLLDDPSLGGQFAAAALHKADTRYRPAHMIAALESCYDQVLGTPG